MHSNDTNSERVLIIAPFGRDAAVAARILQEAGHRTHIVENVATIDAELDHGAAFVVVAEEALATENFQAMRSWLDCQPTWSDLPIILITGRDDIPARNDTASWFQDNLGNVSFLERPFHPTTFVNVARSALRSRLKQYQARDLLERFELLARELQHRTKNLLTVILSIGSATLRDGGEGAEAFFGRLHALAKAQDLLMENSGFGAPLEDVVGHVVKGFETRVRYSGPPVLLNPTAAQGFALIVHELATNASKHGAWTVTDGLVTITWDVEEVPRSNPVVSFSWKEYGGPPAVRPTTKGFGSILLERAVVMLTAPQFDYSTEGFAYRFKAARAVCIGA